MHGSAEFYDVADHRLPEKVRDARFVICVSDFTRSQLMMWLGHDQWRKLHVVHCAIDTEVFRREMDRDGVPDSLHVLTVSRLVLGKGLTFLLEAVAQLRDRGLEVSLTVVGDGPERPALEDQARRLRIEDRVRLLGAIGQDEIRESYAVADAFCLPSFAEGVPVVLMEAMAMQLPVVATRITGVPELVEHGHSGLLVTPARSEELADALERLARSPEERHALGAAGRDKVLSDFELSRSADALARLYREELQV